MRMEANLQMSQKMQMKLAPQIIQSIEILQLPLLELRNRIDQELIENPVLEREEAQETTEENNEETESEEALEEVEAADSEEADFDTFDDFSSYYNDYGSGGSRSSSSDDEKDPKLQALENSPAPDISLQEHLLRQLSYLDLDDRQYELCESIVANLDTRGYLANSLEDIVKGVDGEVSEDEAEEALAVVQDLEPPGVAARDLSECLMLQLDDDHEKKDFLRRLLENYFEDILENRYPQVADAMDCTIEDLKQAVEEISQLNPMPGSLFGEPSAPNVLPDLRVELIDGEYQIFLEDSWLPSLRFNKYYRKKLNDDSLDGKTKEYLKKKMQSARWLIDAIEQRRSTLYNVTTEMMDAQQDFLDHGDAALKPLKMQDIADRAGVHVSTVSRAISGKYIQTPRGIYPLKHFFTGGLQKKSGEMESWEAVRQKLQKIIRDEDKSDPFSDEQISQELKKQGIDIARRTVSKYRKNLGIPSARKRKEY